MNKVKFWPWVSDKNNLYRGDCFENALIEELEYSKKYEYLNGKFNSLFTKLEELKGAQTPQDNLYDLFRENVMLDFDFAKDLKLYDIINADCFYSETEIGKELIYLIEQGELSFILLTRTWYKTSHITLEFEMTHADYVREIHRRLVRGEYIDTF